MLANLSSRNLASSTVITAVLLIAYLGTGIVLFAKNYLFMDVLFALGCLLAPYLFIVRQKGAYSFRYAIPAVLFLLISSIVPVKTFQYLAFAFALLFVVESRLGKVNGLPLMLMALLSPIFRYITEVFGFPIRLQLSKCAGWLIGQTGSSIEVQGNVLILEGYEFAVDPACVGLQLVNVSFLIALFMLAYFERNTGKQLNSWFTTASLIVVGLLVIAANLARIVLLVLFKIMPGHLLHDLTGLVCLLAYVILPSYLLLHWLYKYFACQASTRVESNKPHAWLSVYVPAALLVALVVLSLRPPTPPLTQTSAASPSLNAYTQEIRPDGIIKFEKPDALIYLKPIRAFYNTEHSPLICWQGSGYTFSQINQRYINGTKVYTGTLQKGQEKLYTAWWFDNGTKQTISQWQWRVDMLSGSHSYSLVNVSATNLATLIHESELLLHKQSASLKP